MPRSLDEIIAHIRAVSANPAVSTTLIQTEDLEALCSAAEVYSDLAALKQAQRLATALWEKHWKADAPDWKVQPDLFGVLLQIDNATADLVRKTA